MLAGGSLAGIPGDEFRGDVRHGSMSRVASAGGEGLIAVVQVDELLAAERPRVSDSRK